MAVWELGWGWGMVLGTGWGLGLQGSRGRKQVCRCAGDCGIDNFKCRPHKLP